MSENREIPKRAYSPVFVVRPQLQVDEPAPPPDHRASRIRAVEDVQHSKPQGREAPIPVLGRGRDGEFAQELEAPAINHPQYGSSQQRRVRHEPDDVPVLGRRETVRPSESPGGRRLAAIMAAEDARHGSAAPVSAPPDAALRHDLDALTARVADLAAAIEKITQIAAPRSRRPRIKGN